MSYYKLLICYYKVFICHYTSVIFHNHFRVTKMFSHQIVLTFFTFRLWGRPFLTVRSTYASGFTWHADGESITSGTRE